MQAQNVATTLLPVLGDVASFSPDGAILVTQGWEGLNGTVRLLMIIPFHQYLPITEK